MVSFMRACVCLCVKHVPERLERHLNYLRNYKRNREYRFQGHTASVCETKSNASLSRVSLPFLRLATFSAFLVCVEFIPNLMDAERRAYLLNLFDHFPLKYHEFSAPESELMNDKVINGSCKHATKMKQCP